MKKSPVMLQQLKTRLKGKNVVLLGFVLAIIITTMPKQRHSGSGDVQAGVDPEALIGRWVLINYWAEWCKPCLEEIPELNAFAEAHSEQVSVLGVNYDGVEGEALARVIVRFGIDFPVLTRDPASAYKFARPEVLPVTIVINPEGIVQQRLVGPQTLANLKRVTGL